jgi:RecB family exonuclease
MPAPGVDPMRRGLLLHAALKVIWDELRSRSSLAALDAAGRAACIGAALRTARAELGDLPGGIVELELTQAARQIDALLARELERPDFQVEQTEEWLPIVAGPLALHGKVDRVDRVAGGRAVIDYKAGEGSPGAWAMPRPREPQLPLYALNLPDVAAVAFACLKPGAVGFRGLARDPGALGPGGSRHGNDAAAEWTRMLAEWRAALDDLAGAAQAGDARVDPRDGQVCRMCDLSLLCRREALLRSGALEDV